MTAGPEPPWRAPGEGVAGGPVYAQPVLLRRDDLLIVARDVVAYPWALGFSLHLMWPGGERWPGGPWSRDWDAPPQRGDLRVWVERADGVRVEEAGPRPGETADPPEAPILIPRGGRGEVDWVQDYWLWPAPPPGDVVLGVWWPDRDVPESRATITARQMDAARGRIIDP